MPGYIFLPVPTQEMLEAAEDFRRSQQANAKTPYTILLNYESGWRKGFMRSLGLGVLRNVAAEDKLYLVCHGAGMGSRFTGADRGAKKVGRNWEGGIMKKYSPSQIATVIKEEGLLTSFIQLRVYICGSGLVPHGATKSFAQDLAIELGTLGYQHIRVIGYLGAVKTGNGLAVLLGDGPQGGGYYPAEDHRVAFGPHGGQVPLAGLVDTGI
jgi:hypothetical protein